jgi:transcriptional regulator with XRE-family HTH domain
MAEHGQVGGGLPTNSTLAERLAYLFDTVRPLPEELGSSDEAGRAYMNKEIADKINALAPSTGVTISAAYVGELRRGVASDPRVSHIRALAKAFGVDAAYFLGDDQVAEEIRRQVELLRSLRDMNVKQIALRQVLADTGLSPASSELVQQMVERLREVDQRSS